MYYYGFEHYYGANMRDCNGDLIGKLVIFNTRKARDAWVNGGNPFITQRGSRTKIRSKYAARFQKVCDNFEFAE